MKHGRRHDRLKEKAYLDRKDAEGYARPYEPIPVAEPDPRAPATAPEPEPAPAPAVAHLLGRKAKHALRHAGVDPDAEREE